MSVDLRQHSLEARRLFEVAERVTGLPIATLCEAGPIERLTATEVAQPAVVVTSLAALTVLTERAGGALHPMAAAGHSVGELTACVAVGALDEESSLRLVHTRAQAMAQACARVDGTMAAVLGLEEGQLREVCASASTAAGTVELANLNAPGQLVLSGERRAVERAAELARAAGARRVLPINVAGPFHSVYMRPAAATLRHALARAPLVDARIPLVANVDGRDIVSAEDIRRELSAQVAAPVQWIATIHRLARLGCDRFLEVGPGQVVAGLVRRILPGARVASFGDMADLEAALALLDRQPANL